MTHTFTAHTPRIPCTVTEEIPRPQTTTRDDSLVPPCIAQNQRHPPAVTSATSPEHCRHMNNLYMKSFMQVCYLMSIQIHLSRMMLTFTTKTTLTWVCKEFVGKGPCMSLAKFTPHHFLKYCLLPIPGT
jgi:hypothetical protein